jgi:hypothetical protein
MFHTFDSPYKFIFFFGLFPSSIVFGHAPIIVVWL